jgi:MraZ protein
MFLSTTTNNLDAKSRISVPSDFRSEVSGSAFDGVVVWPSLTKNCLEGGDITLIEGFVRSLDKLSGLSEFDDKKEAILVSIIGAGRKLSFDGGGRITLPKEFAEFASLSDRATFVGLGRRFEIWEPDTHEARLVDARRIARENQHLLRPVESYPAPGEA